LQFLDYPERNQGLIPKKSVEKMSDPVEKGYMEGTIVFSSGRAADFDIFVLDPKTAEVRQLTTGPYVNDQPRWSPDKRTIAFISNRTGTYQLWLMNPDGSNQRQLTFDNVHHMNPAWSPDGSGVACCANYHDKEEINIWRVPLATPNTPEILVENTGLEGDFCFSPDGTKLCFAATYSGNYDLWELNLLSKERKQLTCHAGRDFGPAYSPDGTMLAFVSTPEWEPSSKKPPTNADVYLMMADGKKEPLKVTKNRGADMHVCWSPSGNALCYAAGARTPGAARLQVIDLLDGSLVRLAYDRSKLEGELNAEVYDSNLLTKLLPDSLQRAAVYLGNPAYFGTERCPDWR
jgi:Tol biopolymer transport system component